MTAYRIIGQPLPRVDGQDKVTGLARYTADKSLLGMLWARALRSPLAHARILRIDVTKAAALPGVHAVLTGADIPDVLYGRRLRDIPVLARDLVRFIGERVAGVAAEDPDTAQAAADLIEVEYQELPAVFEPQDALADDAPLLHPDVNSYANLPKLLEKLSNAFVHDVWGKGDLALGFAEADLVVESSFTTQRAHQAYLEPHSCLVWIDEQGRVQLWAPNKAPHRLKHDFAVALGLPEEQILVNHSTIGADFGGKGSPMDMPLCYFLAQRTGRPIKMVMDYTEEFTAANPRHPSVTQMKTGVKRDGTLVAHQARLLFNSGAYGGFKPVPGANLPGAEHAGGPYRIPHVRIEALQVYTNTIPGGFFRGPGGVQAIFAIESHMDIIARRLGIDPLDLRLKNLLREGDETPTGHQVPGMKSMETLQAAVEAADYHAPRPPNVGRGIAVNHKDQGEGQSSAAVSLAPDGSVVLSTSVFEQGTGSYTAFRQIVAEELGLPPERVQVRAWNTDEAPFDTGIGATRVTRVAVPATYNAARQARQELLRLAAELLGWPEERLTMSGDSVIRQDTGESRPWPELLARVGHPVVAQATNRETEPAPATAFMAQIAEVSVDPETGQVRLLRVVSAHDVARILNPVGHQGQINGGAIQGVGYALTEELRVVDGQVETTNFGDYKIPTIRDIPELRTVLVESAGGLGPYQTKGIGEYAIEGVAAAVANAVADAIGARVHDLPVTAEKVLRALQEGSIR
jgi:CO/xanthine dehydrogenase Mo-binding subunit